MKNNGRTLAILLTLSLAAAAAGVVIIYKAFPELLFQIVYISHESGGTGEELIRENIEENSQYAEYFHPEESYLKSIVLHMGILGEQPPDSDGNMAVNMKLMKDDGIILAEKNLDLADMAGIGFQEFSLESRVEKGQAYRALITFPDFGNLYITASMDQIGPGEHVMLMINGEESEETLYMQYIYGTYSRKLLMIWFLVFFVTAFLLMEWLGAHYKSAGNNNAL